MKVEMIDSTSPPIAWSNSLRRLSVLAVYSTIMGTEYGTKFMLFFYDAAIMHLYILHVLLSN